MKSLTAGPKNFEDAIKSPFWRRPLIAEDRQSSNIIVFLEDQKTEKPVEELERIVHKMDESISDSQAGSPYLVEMIRRYLAHISPSA